MKALMVVQNKILFTPQFYFFKHIHINKTTTITITEDNQNLENLKQNRSLKNNIYSVVLGPNQKVNYSGTENFIFFKTITEIIIKNN